jgi:hypothetical protein
LDLNIWRPLRPLLLVSLVCEKRENMLISARYKTDIPTLYGEWFMNH